MKKKLVVYYSLGGTAKETALKLQAENKEMVDIYDVKSAGSVDLSKYETVYIGSGVYGGNFPMEISKYIAANSNILKTKQIMIFIHALGSEEKYQAIIQKALGSNIPFEKCNVFYLGGKADTEKQNFFIKSLIKMLAKKRKLDLLHPNNINKASEAKLLKTVNQ